MAEQPGPQGPPNGSAKPTALESNSSKQLGFTYDAKDNPKPKSVRPNYHKIHAQPLPLTIHPLPPLIPHNPLSLLHIAFVYLRQLVFTPLSLPSPRFIGYFSPETCSVHITDPRSVRCLWEQGFFGKGSLSRSEPTWLDREKRKLGLLAEATSEEWTAKRREERRLFKLERARQEQMIIDATIRGEVDGGADGTKKMGEGAVAHPGTAARLALEERIAAQQKSESSGKSGDKSAAITSVQSVDEGEEGDEEIALVNEEHLQLTLDEAFFLAFSLGALTITYPPSTSSIAEPNSNPSNDAIPPSSLLPLFASHSIFPPLTPPYFSLSRIDPANPFLISYIAYHHFRSLGWVVRPGIKFSCDLLLYLRGPAFSHAEFAVIIQPAFGHEYWQKGGRDGSWREKKKEWFWIHMVNRVQSQVRKSLVVCFVEVPPPLGEVGGEEKDMDVKGLLERYKVREFVIKRWTPNRNRD